MGRRKIAKYIIKQAEKWIADHPKKEKHNHNLLNIAEAIKLGDTFELINS